MDRKNFFSYGERSRETLVDLLTVKTFDPRRNYDKLPKTYVQSIEDMHEFLKTRLHSTRTGKESFREMMEESIPARTVQKARRTDKYQVTPIKHLNYAWKNLEGVVLGPNDSNVISDFMKRFDNDAERIFFLRGYLTLMHAGQRESSTLNEDLKWHDVYALASKYVRQGIQDLANEKKSINESTGRPVIDRDIQYNPDYPVTPLEKAARAVWSSLENPQTTNDRIAARKRHIEGDVAQLVIKVYDTDFDLFQGDARVAAEKELRDYMSNLKPHEQKHLEKIHGNKLTALHPYF